MNDPLRGGVCGRPRLTGRLEPWMRELLDDPGSCNRLIDRFGSPVNVIEPAPLSRNAAELVSAGKRLGVDVRLFFARKANKALSLVAAADRAGHGVDVASLAELQQAVGVGVPGERVVLTAAVKPRSLLEAAVDAGVMVAADTVAELIALTGIAVTAGRTARVLLRLAPNPGQGIPPTRFGELPERWLEALAGGPEPGRAIVGVHAHLHGYRVDHRLSALGECLHLVDALIAAGHRPAFIDLGGGVPMSYLDDADEWRGFWTALRLPHTAESFTWKDARLESVYPYFQEPVRAGWLETLLAGHTPGHPGTAAQELTKRGLALHLEPGRCLLDGCGLTLTRVAFVKCRSDGVPLIGLEMNRTQCRSTSDDFLVDPVLVRRATPGPAIDGFLVGTYCIEDELILQRRMHFPNGVAPGDLVAFVNTAGYLMHILESASHQIPLAKNVVRNGEDFVLDPIDEPAEGGAPSAQIAQSK